MKKLQTLWDKDKMLVPSVFSITHNVYKRPNLLELLKTWNYFVKRFKKKKIRMTRQSRMYPSL